MKKRVQLLQLGRDLPLRNPIVLEGAVVEHAEMDMQVHHAGYQGAMAGVDQLSVLWHSHMIGRSDRLDALAVQQDDRILHNGLAIADDESLALDCLYPRVAHRIGFSCWKPRSCGAGMTMYRMQPARSACIDSIHASHRGAELAKGRRGDLSRA